MRPRMPAVALALLLCLLTPACTSAVNINFGAPVRISGRPANISVTFSNPVSSLSLYNFQLLVNNVAVGWKDAVLYQVSPAAAVIKFNSATSAAGTYTLTFTNRGSSLCSALLPIPAAATSAAKLIGSGTAASCTEAALRAALKTAGTYKFNCGPNPVRIGVTKEIPLPHGSPDQNCCDNPQNNPPLVLDGNGLVTLVGGGSNRLFSLDNFNFVMTNPKFTFQNLKFTNFRYTDATTGKGGGVYYGLGGSVSFVNCELWGNSAPAPPCNLGPYGNCTDAQGQPLKGPGQDTAGGAINTQGGGYLRIAGSRLWGNTASNGGAIGVLGTGSVWIADSWIYGNKALGTVGNPGNGGNGGAMSMDGSGSRDLRVCGTVWAANAANKFGGALFRTTDFGSPPPANATFTRCLFDANVGPSGNAVLYLQGGEPVISGCTFTRNKAGYGGGVYLSWGTDTATISNTIFAGNYAILGPAAAIDINGGATGTLSSLTIAHNSALVANGAIRDSYALVLSRSVIDEQCWGAPSAPGTCAGLYTDGGGNFQSRTCSGNGAPDCAAGASVSLANTVTPLAPNDYCVVPSPGSPAAAAKAGATCDSQLYGAALTVDVPSGTPVSGGASTTFT